MSHKYEPSSEPLLFAVIQSRPYSGRGSQVKSFKLLPLRSAAAGRGTHTSTDAFLPRDRSAVPSATSISSDCSKTHSSPIENLKLGRGSNQGNFFWKLPPRMWDTTESGFYGEKWSATIFHALTGAVWTYKGGRSRPQVW